MEINQVENILKDNEYLFSFLDIKILKIENGYCEIMIPFKKEFTRLGNILHGGIIMTLLDYAGAMAVLSINKRRNQVTQELKINFLEPMKDGPFYSKGEVIKSNDDVAIVSIEFYDSKGKLGAKALGTWYMK
ncbi:PaaI family thioesterase [Acidianus brierleyi]|uniref:Esterase n=1 Tax=Acidianus brierleyi TaxID=41673 RepID=A0A2U9IJ67_9CREN|nr:PaaI family thioesterase [Acidianus brierleyi]AWR96077.1 hotdog fold thioesterase [Acidianus brierleyi]